MAKITTNFPSFESLIDTIEEYQSTISEVYSFSKSSTLSNLSNPQTWLSMSMDNSKMEAKFTDGHALFTGDNLFSKFGKPFDMRNFASMEVSLKNIVAKVLINEGGINSSEFTDGVNTIVRQKLSQQETSSFYSNTNSQILINEISQPSTGITLVSSFHVNNSKYQFDVRFDNEVDGIDISANVSEDGAFEKLLKNQKTVDFLKGILDEDNAVSGMDGSEYLFSFDGNDTFDAKKGNDTIDAGAGNDTLVGGQGVDKLTGGKGADVFKYTSIKDSGITTTTRDTITDFKTSDGDKIDLSAIDANEKITGYQAFTFIGSAAFSKTDASGQLRFDSTSKILYASTDTDSSPEFAIQLSGVKSLSASDLIL